MPITKNNIPELRRQLTAKGGKVSEGVRFAVGEIAFRYHRAVTANQAVKIGGEYFGSDPGEYPYIFTGEASSGITACLNPGDPLNGRAGVFGEGVKLTWLAGEEPGGGTAQGVGDSSAGDEDGGTGARGRRKGLTDIFAENRAEICQAVIRGMQSVRIGS